MHTSSEVPDCEIACGDTECRGHEAQYSFMFDSWRSLLVSKHSKADAESVTARTVRLLEMAKVNRKWRQGEVSSTRPFFAPPQGLFILAFLCLFISFQKLRIF